jgi:hypothetical protein
MDLQDALDQEREDNARLRQQVAVFSERADPYRQQRERAAEEEGELQIISRPREARQLMYQQHQIITEQRRELEANKVNHQLAAVHRAYPEEFETAYKALLRLDRRDPAAQAQVQAIWNAPHSGAALMQWHQGYARMASRGGIRMPPSLNSSQRGYGAPSMVPSQRSQRPVVGNEQDEWPRGLGNEGSGYEGRYDPDIFAHAMA